MKKTTREWVKKAEQDYVVAKQTSRSKVPVHDSVCFHCQQCAEKYLKGLMAELGISVPKTHDLELLETTRLDQARLAATRGRKQHSPGHLAVALGCREKACPYCVNSVTLSLAQPLMVGQRVL